MTRSEMQSDGKPNSTDAQGASQADAVKSGARTVTPGGKSRQRGAERPPAEMVDQRRRLWTKLDPEYTFTPHYAKFDDQWIHFVDEGMPNRPTLLLIHGNPTWSFYWRKLIERLRSSYRVVAIDLLGCGLSEKPRDYDYRLENHVRSVEFLVEELGLGALTLGMHDWGGAIGMGFARRHPDQVERLFAMNTAAFHMPNLPRRLTLARTPLLGDLLIKRLNMFSRGALKTTMKRREKLSRIEKRGYLAPYKGAANRTAVHEFVKDIPMSPTHRSWDELKATDDAVASFNDRPTLLLWGMRDPIFQPRFLDEWIVRWPDAEVHRYDDCGHWLMEDAGDDVSRKIDAFLSRKSAAKAAS